MSQAPIVFAGTPVFAACALQALLDAGIRVDLVLTQPDRPSGRGLKLLPSAVKQVAQAHGIAVAQPVSLRAQHANSEYAQAAAACAAQLREIQPALMIVAAYGLILPQSILDIPTHGCINIHASLLPRWRGAAPIHRAIEAGDRQTGISLMQMDAGLDTGGVLHMQSCDIHEAMTTGQLHDVLSDMGAQMTVDYVRQLLAGHVGVAMPQPLEGVTYAEKIQKSEARIDWHVPVAHIERRVRAFSPNPVAWLDLPQMVKVWQAQCVPLDVKNPHTSPVGSIVRIDRNGVCVAGVEGDLLLMQLQKSGGKPAPAHQVAESLGWTVGQVLSAS